MRVRGLLVAVVLLAGLGGLLYWSNKKQKADEGKPAADTPKLVTVSPTDFQKVELKRKGGETLVVERDKDGKWAITAPVPLRADQDSVNGLLTAFGSLNADKVVEEKPADLAQFGLQAPNLEVTGTKKDGKRVKVLIGDDTPTGGGAFAKTPEDPKVYTVASFVKTSLDKSSNDLRDKRLLTFDGDKLARVELTAKGQTLEFGKNAKGDWSILKPQPLRADGIQVDELVRKLKDAKIDPAVSPEDAKKAAAGFAVGAPVAVVKVTDNAGTQQLEVRKRQEDYYAKSSAIDGVHKIAADLGSGLDKKVDDFRNKKVFDFGFNEVTKVEVRDGAKVSQFQKSGEKWMSGSQEMDAVGAQSVIDKLREVAAAKFLDSGFPAATFEVSVGYGSTTEKVLFARSGDKALAKRDNEPAVYELEAKALEEIQKAVSEMKPAQPPADTAKGKDAKDGKKK